jgi:DNA-binding transcriptional MerR regulator
MTATQEQAYSSAQLMRQSGLTYRQLDYYCAMGYLAPAEDEPGSGHPRRYSEDQVRIAVLIKKLLDAGFTVSAAATLAREHVETGRPLVVNADGWLLIGARSRA